MKKRKLCACGCGDYAKPNRKYINGHNRRGVEVSDETKAKIAKAQRNQSNETRLKRSEAGKNRPPVSDETRAKLSKSAKNHPVTDETKLKISKANKNPSNEIKAKMSESHKNPSDEIRAKMSKAAKNRIHLPCSDETKAKISIANKGYKHTDEAKAKMSKARRNQSDEIHQKRSEAAKNKPPMTDEARQKMSATHQGISYDEWESFACEKLYCSDFDEELREVIREKYGRQCFLSGLPELENIGKNGKQRKLSVHHYDMDKEQGCKDKIWKLVPLCMEWHGKVHNKLWEARIIWLLDNVWCNQKVYIQ